MIKVGITGHQMRDGIDWCWVRGEIRSALNDCGTDAVLWSCLATGADTIAAEEALASNIRLNVVIPHSHYADVFSDADRRIYKSLLERADEVVAIERVQSDEQAYLEAGLKVVDICDLLLVVWDGREAAGKGGTGDVAKHAYATGTSVLWLNTLKSEIQQIKEAFS